MCCLIVLFIRGYVMKKYLILFIMLLLLAGCSNRSDTAKNIAASDIGINKRVSDSLPEITQEMEEFKNVVDGLMKDNFEDYKLYYDGDGALNIDLVFEGVAIETFYAMNNNQQYLDDWNNMAEALTASSKSLLETAQLFDIKDPVVVINVINDLNRDKIVFSARNGEILYDALNDRQ